MPETVGRKTLEAKPDLEAETVHQTGWRGSARLGVPFTCPACWPAYSGLLSSLGLGFADYAAYILPLTSFSGHRGWLPRLACREAAGLLAIHPGGAWSVDCDYR